MKSFPNYVAVWMTYGDKGTPWAADFAKHNPGVVQYVCTATSPASEDAWRNCDRNVRAWCIEHLAEVDTEWVVFLEWDVMVRANLAAALGNPRRGIGLIGPAVMQGVRDRQWPIFPEISRLPLDMRAGAIGIAPFAVCAVRRDVLALICEERFDALYDADIFCELRTPTLVSSLGFGIGQAAALRDVGLRPLRTPAADVFGIFHPVKNP